jgi:ATP-dependent DNA ligase
VEPCIPTLTAKPPAGPGWVHEIKHDGYRLSTVFRRACRFGFEGIVSKCLSAPYRSGPSRDWLKVKNLRMRPQRHLLVRTHG